MCDKVLGGGSLSLTDNHFFTPAALDRWERELQLFGALRRLKVFRMYKLWKSFR